VHRKDFMPLLEKKLAYDAEYSNETQRAWDFALFLLRSYIILLYNGKERERENDI